MAYQNVGGTPRFYIDYVQYLKSINFDFEKYDEGIGDAPDRRLISDSPELFNLDPSVATGYTHKLGSSPSSNNYAEYCYWDVQFSFNSFNSSGNLGLYVAFLNNKLYTATLTSIIDLIKYCLIACCTI